MKEQTIQAKKYDILGVKFDLVSYEEVLDAINRWRKNGEHCYITQTPPCTVMMCHRHEELRRATNGAGLTLPDGVGIILAANLLRYPHHGRVSGPELMLRLCDWSRKHGYRHFFYGGAEGVADKLAERLSETYPGLQVAGRHCPPFRPLTEDEDREIVEEINSTHPDIVWVGLGSPKQEKWMAQHVGAIKAAAMIGVGAAFDFHSGTVKWAPAWIRRLGLETIYRIIQEPRRISPRVVDDISFAIRAACQSIVRTFTNLKS